MSRPGGDTAGSETALDATRRGRSSRCSFARYQRSKSGLTGCGKGRSGGRRFRLSLLRPALWSAAQGCVITQAGAELAKVSRVCWGETGHRSLLDPIVASRVLQWPVFADHCVSASSDANCARIPRAAPVAQQFPDARRTPNRSSRGWRSASSRLEALPSRCAHPPPRPTMRPVAK